MQSNKHESQEDYWRYNCRDCTYTREVGERELEAIHERGLKEVDDFQQELFWPVLKAMLRGVRVDERARGAMAAELAAALKAREGYFQKVLGHNLNPRSAKQMQALFYQDLGLPIIWKKTEAGTVPTLDDKALRVIKRKEPLVRNLIRTIQEIRSIGTFQSNYIEMRLDEDGRARCGYNICGTKEYRFNSKENAFGSGRNLQNIPKGGESDDEDSDLVLPNIRKIFVPDEDQEFFDLDLSKADLRVVVWESNCAEMKAMLAEGRDPYIETAREFYRDPTISKYNPDGTENVKYDRFKRFSHGTHYLGTPQGLSQRIGLTVHEATRTQAWYFGKYPQIKAWQSALIEEIRRTHSVRNKFGYVFNFFGRIDDSTFREAVAWIPASTVACVINRIWVGLHKSSSTVEVLLQVHDSLAGQFPIGERDAALADLQRCGEVVVPYDEPLIIPIGVKTSTKSWGDCQ